MNSADAERILTPIWLGFAAAEARAEAMLLESLGETLDRGNAAQRLQHEAQVMQALEYIRARKAAYLGSGLLVAVDTGRAVRIWPNVYPDPDAPARVVEAWKNKADGKVEELRRPA